MSEMLCPSPHPSLGMGPLSHARGLTGLDAAVGTSMGCWAVCKTPHLVGNALLESKQQHSDFFPSVCTKGLRPACLVSGKL